MILNWICVVYKKIPDVVCYDSLSNCVCQYRIQNIHTSENVVCQLHKTPDASCSTCTLEKLVEQIHNEKQSKNIFFAMKLFLEEPDKYSYLIEEVCIVKNIGRRAVVNIEDAKSKNIKSALLEYIMHISANKYAVIIKDGVNENDSIDSMASCYMRKTTPVDVEVAYDDSEVFLDSPQYTNLNFAFGSGCMSIEDGFLYHVLPTYCFFNIRSINAEPKTYLNVVQNGPHGDHFCIRLRIAFNDEHIDCHSVSSCHAVVFRKNNDILRTYDQSYVNNKIIELNIDTICQCIHDKSSTSLYDNTFPFHFFPRRISPVHTLSNSIDEETRRITSILFAGINVREAYFFCCLYGIEGGTIMWEKIRILVSKDPTCSISAHLFALYIALVPSLKHIRDIYVNLIVRLLEDVQANKISSKTYDLLCELIQMQESLLSNNTSNSLYFSSFDPLENDLKKVILAEIFKDVTIDFFTGGPFKTGRDGFGELLVNTIDEINSLDASVLRSELNLRKIQFGSNNSHVVLVKILRHNVNMNIFASKKELWKIISSFRQYLHCTKVLAHYKPLIYLKKVIMHCIDYDRKMNIRKISLNYNMAEVENFSSIFWDHMYRIKAFSDEQRKDVNNASSK